MYCDFMGTALVMHIAKYSKNIKRKQKTATPPWLNNPKYEH